VLSLSSLSLSLSLRILLTQLVAGSEHGITGAILEASDRGPVAVKGVLDAMRQVRTCTAALVVSGSLVAVASLSRSLSLSLSFISVQGLHAIQYRLLPQVKVHKPDLQTPFLGPGSAVADEKADDATYALSASFYLSLSLSLSPLCEHLARR
jgi:hypothetical protein